MVKLHCLVISKSFAKKGDILSFEKGFLSLSITVIMEIALIILSSLLMICVTVSVIAVLKATSEMQKEKLRFDELAESVFDYNLEWTEDLSEIKFGKKLENLLISCGIPRDKSYILNVFGNNGDIAESSMSLCVNAVRKSGIISEYYSADGISGLIHWKSVSLNLPDGRLKVYSLGRDISDETLSRKVTEQIRQQLVEEFEFIKIAASNAEAGVISFITDGDGIFISAAPQICSLLGFENDDAFSLEQFLSLVDKEDVIEVERQIKCFVSGINDSLYVEASVKTVKGQNHTLTIECKYNSSSLDYRHARTGMVFDTTISRANREEAFKDSQKDLITGLYNRNGFMIEGKKYLEKLKSEEKQAVLVCIQVQRLRKISMLFGIEVSDTLSKLYAETITGVTGDNAIVGKVGVEDFAIMYICSEEEEVEALMKKIGIVVENFCNNETLPAVLKEQASFIAGACFYDGNDDISTFFNKASVTLFSGLRKPGKICCFFDKHIEKQVSGRDIVEHEISEALKLGELELYYQPKISVHTGEIVGAEALMRWNHKTQGLIMPNEFIHVAEEMGIITKIDEWGMLQACIQNRIWQEKGYDPIKISVNMSQAQLYQTDVVASVKNALAESGIDASCLEVELTETMAMIDIDRTISILNSLKELGVSISMDDFGTGYSSLSSLKILPIDLLKIDRSLVYDIETNNTARCITKAIVELGKAMELIVLAEGVETVDQQNILKELGCDIIQGFLYSKPQPAAMVEKMFLIPAMERKQKAKESAAKI